MRPGHEDARRRHRAHEFDPVQVFGFGQRRSRNPHKLIDGHAFRLRVQGGEAVQQGDAIFPRFSHAENPPAADPDAGGAYVFQRSQPIGEGPRGDDAAVERLGCVQVVVVVVEPGFCQSPGLGFGEQSQGGAGFHAHFPHGLDHGGNLPDLGVLRAPVGCAHAESGRAGRLGLRGRPGHFLHAHQVLGGDTGVVANALRAVGAVFRAGAGLDGQQRRYLHRVGIEVLPVDPLGFVQQVIERHFVKSRDRVQAPVGPEPDFC